MRSADLSDEEPGERLLSRCKQFGPLATRYEKRAENFRPLWSIAVLLLRL